MRLGQFVNLIFIHLIKHIRYLWLAGLVSVYWTLSQSTNKLLLFCPKNINYISLKSIICPKLLHFKELHNSFLSIFLSHSWTKLYLCFFFYSIHKLKCKLKADSLMTFVCLSCFNAERSQSTQKRQREEEPSKSGSKSGRQSK